MLCKLPAHDLRDREAMNRVLDRACVGECPVDGIYQGGRAFYIQPLVAGQPSAGHSHGT
jgi:hypothetical protein